MYYLVRLLHIHLGLRCLLIDEAIHLDLDGLDMEKVYAYKEANQTGRSIATC